MTFSKQRARLCWNVAAANAIRLLLVLLGVGETLLWQPLVTTPANTALKTREGLALLKLKVSPYDGDSCSIPPLWLAVTAPVALHPVLCVIPNVIADVVAAAALYAAASALYTGRSATGTTQRDAPWVSASQLALCYLFNPFTIMSCVAGTLTSAENAAVLVAVAGGCLRNGPLVGSGLAVGAYLGLHPLLLLVPLMLMLWRGSEDPLQPVPTTKQHTSSSAVQAAELVELDTAAVLEATSSRSPPGTRLRSRRTAAAAVMQQQQQQHQQQQDQSELVSEQLQQVDHKAAVQQRSLIPCIWCAASFLVCASALLLLSDHMLQQHPTSQCIGPLLAAVQGSQGSSRAALKQLAHCWAGRVYGWVLLLRDLTPNMGMWWYFFTEVFTEFQAFFLFVFHSFSLILLVPMAIRFPQRPLFVTWVQLFMSCMFRPYACVGDMVPWLALLPLLQQQLQSLKLKMFLVNSFALLMVLGPAMWHQWIVLDSANANFFYSITLLLGVWNTVFLLQMLRLTVLLDRWLAGKGPPPVLVSADGCEVHSEGVAQYAAALQAQVLGAEKQAPGV